MKPKNKLTSKIKRKKVVTLTLSKFELMHLRDLMSVMLPSEGQKSLSSMLAATENRHVIESMLWDKIVAACEDCKLPTGDAAPDYIVAPTGMTPLGVFQIASDPNDDGEGDGKSDPTDISNLFKDK